MPDVKDQHFVPLAAIEDDIRESHDWKTAVAGIVHDEVQLADPFDADVELASRLPGADHAALEQEKLVAVDQETGAPRPVLGIVGDAHLRVEAEPVAAQMTAQITTCQTFTST